MAAVISGPMLSPGLGAILCVVIGMRIKNLPKYVDIYLEGKDYCYIFDYKRL